LAFGGAGIAALGLAGCGGGGDTPLEAGREAPLGVKPKFAPPLLGAPSATQKSISISVTAGADGMPAGFSLQWVTRAHFDQYGWSDSLTEAVCNGGFSGNANLSRYNLAAGESVTVIVGDLLLDSGASTNCPGELECGTEYVFRAFAHATKDYQRSDDTPNLFASTLGCAAACTYTQGYWKNHADAWPVDSLVLGTVSYSQAELLAILGTPVGGGKAGANGLIALAHQLIAAKLNVANGAAVPAEIATADALIGGLVVPPSGAGYLAPATTSALVFALSTYNEGGPDGVNHCTG
jgi:hypothetical protein